MPLLADSQSRFIACLQKGPAHFPDHLFSEDRARALLGLKAHANTISHARLVALENAYPKVHAHLGHEDFHAISRDYIEQDHILTRDMNMIAADFAAYLDAIGHHGTVADLARIEWAWLESYRAAEADPLELTDIATLGEEDLLALVIGAHPAIRLISLTGTLSSELNELGDETPDALMIARPAAQVLFHSMSALEHEIAKKIANVATMGNLLNTAIELGGEATAMEHVIKLIQAGALTRFKG